MVPVIRATLWIEAVAGDGATFRKKKVVFHSEPWVIIEYGHGMENARIMICCNERINSLSWPMIRDIVP